MLTDASEIGPLDCDSWDEQFVERLAALARPEAERLVGHIKAESSRNGLDYIKDDGERIIIPIAFAPARFTARHVTGLRKAFEGLAAAVAKVAAAWLETPALQQVLPLEPYESQWLQLAREAPGDPPARIFPRWDYSFNLSDDPLAEHFKLFELNSVDVGGIHYAAATRLVMADALTKLSVADWSHSDDDCGRDTRLVLANALRDHADRIGKRLARVAIAENQDFTTGVTEAESICKFLQSHGHDAQCVDARGFETSPQKGVCHRGKPIDVVYRNIELRDLADLETAGGDLSGLRQAAETGKLLSSPFGELDHKSLWEALGSEEFAELFTDNQRQLISQHVPWTRLLRERGTSDPGGKRIDLPDFVRRSQNALVMKPNRSCGGQGVTIGRTSSAADWQRTLDAALQSPNTWVAQEFISIPRRRTCRLTESGFEPDEAFSVYGGYYAPGSVGFVGRASHSPVVNVMQGGGLLAVVGQAASH
jgi:hypothetical protein